MQPIISISNAWVEWDDIVVNDVQAIKSRFLEMNRVPRVRKEV